MCVCVCVCADAMHRKLQMMSSQNEDKQESRQPEARKKTDRQNRSGCSLEDSTAKVVSRIRIYLAQYLPAITDSAKQSGHGTLELLLLSSEVTSSDYYPGAFDSPN